MKIVYLINEDLHLNSGVIQKIKQQSKQWIKEEHTVYFVSYKTMSIYNSKYEIIHKEKTLDITLWKIGTFIRLFNNSYAIKALLEKIDFDMIYTRHMRFMPFFNRILKTNTVVMEINSDDVAEYKLQSKFRYLYNLLTRDLILKHVDAFISVSRELKVKFEKYHKPIIVIANGINTTLYEVVEKKNQKPILVFIGSPNQAWHGVNKIIDMSKHYTDYQFYIIGTDGSDTPNLKYFGYLSDKESIKLLNKADIGIGTLSLYKNNMNEASPLKTRQYLACGLPLIYAYTDTDIERPTEFTVKLENKEDNLDYKKIDEFIENVFNNKSVNQQARVFAQNILDYDKKEILRLEFFKKILK